MDTTLEVAHCLNRETVQQKYRNRISERSLSPLSATVGAIIAQ